jgi:flagellar biogenesis protein FliO
MDFLFGEGQFGLRILVAVFLVLALIGGLAWLVRVFRFERTGTASRRARQPRLAVIDAAAVDGRRRLVIIRRDNVEHLLMIGGPTDIVVEPNIVRATVREPALARPPAVAEELEAAPTVVTPPRPQQEPVLQHTESEPPVP